MVLAQHWPDLAQDGSDDGALLAALEAFNDWRMQKKTKQEALLPIDVTPVSSRGEEGKQLGRVGMFWRAWRAF